MADPVISLLLERLADLIEKKVSEEINLVRGVKKEVHKLSTVLRTIQSVLNDAEKRTVEDETVKNWLEQLEDAFYDMDDVLDEWKTAVLKRQIGGDEEAPLPENEKKVSCSILSPFSCFKQVSTRRDIALKIKELNERLDFIDKQKDRYNFLPSKDDELKEFKPVETNSLIDESEIYGRDSAKESLVSTLLYDNSEQESPFRVISVVGTGGIGKTTLAKLAYNDHRVNNSFDHRIWVCVSDPFDIIHVAKAIIESLTGNSPNLSRLDPLLSTIQNLISQKSFLLVLDDVWTEDSTKWEPLRTCLKNGARGSSVLVTTRSEGIAKSMGAAHMHRLDQLSDADCWSLVHRIAFSVQREPNHEKFEDIGREIAKRCKGLPLAAKTMGSLLLLKNTIDEWKSVLESKIWKLNKVEVELFPHLYLSYSHLPLPLRRCFSYCAIFPKDYVIEADKLIKIWMAQGYLSSSRNEDQMQQRGREYLEDLATRSFFQDLRRDESDGRILSCKMHDIVHDFAQYLRRTECFSVERVEGLAEGMANLSSQKAYRHLTWLSSFEATTSPSITGFEKLRTFFGANFHEMQLLAEIFRHMKFVHVLSLHSGCLQRLPDEIGNLIHLRYLDLSDNPLEQLPETVCDLCNLQTLNLQRCGVIWKLPQEIEKLTNLRHLLTEKTGRLKRFPEGLEKLTGLQTLSYFQAGIGFNKLGFLHRLNRIGGCLEIQLYGLMNETDVIDAEKAGLANKTNIQHLKLNFGMEIRLDVLEALQPPPNLERLEMCGYKGLNFPNWMTTSLHNLRELIIKEWQNYVSLPPLWKLQSLEKLEIATMRSMKRIGLEFFGITSPSSSSSSSSSSLPTVAFPKLKRLSFLDCIEWEEWEDATDKEHLVSVMPCLEELIVSGCIELKALPDQLLGMISTLKHLSIQDSTQLLERYGADENQPKIALAKN